jgi:hypothetical protein
MLSIPYEVLSCSWPRPIDEQGQRWTSDPEWNAPLMPFSPRPSWTLLGDAPCWTIDWCAFFRAGVGLPNAAMTAEMRRFHVILRVRMMADGELCFYDDDGSIVRRNGVVVHEDRTAHGPRSSTLRVRAGEELEIAQWQYNGSWIWGARITSDERPAGALDVLRPYRDLVAKRLGDPQGPPLKMYTNGAHAARVVVAVYSLVLRGYVPSAIHLFGSEQWSPATRALFAELLPFAEVVDPARLLEGIAAAGGARLADWARRYWYVMKTAVALLHAPDEFCLLDDDVFVLGSHRDALEHFAQADLVYMPDFDHTRDYLSAWKSVNAGPPPLRTSRFNAGLYWMRNRHDRRQLAQRALGLSPTGCHPWMWEQGFIACLFAGGPVHELPSHRYFYPIVDGMPGGILGYDYAANPCGFASVHFGGLDNKPNDAATLALAGDILSR